MSEGEDQVRIARARTAIDLATIGGIVLGFAFVIMAIVLGGAVMAFVDVKSILIVVLGGLAITAASFSLGEFLGAPKIVLKTLFHTSRDPAEMAIQMIQLSDMARKKGVLGLETVVEELKNDTFLHKGMSMVVDGSSGEEVEAVMRRELNSTIERHDRATEILRRAAEVSPAMGLIGTLVGLVQMLKNLDDPSSIGPAMAVALLTTLYGAILANMVYSPLVSKLERNSADEMLVNRLQLVGAASIGRQDNPRRLEMLLNSMLPPRKRVDYFGDE